MTGGISLQPLVFISYSSLDEKRARDLVDALEKRSIACWLAKRDIKLGENFADKIPEVISKAPAFVLVYSNNADSSDEVKKELQLARKRKKPIFPIRLENVNPTEAFEYELVTVQWVDAFDGWEAGVDKLAKAINDVIVAGGNEIGSDRGDGLQVRRSPKSKFWIAAACGFVGVFVAGTVAITQRTVPDPEPQSRSRGSPPQTTSDNSPAPSQVPSATEPNWETLPPGSNFANLGKDIVAVRNSRDASSHIIADIQPGSTLYFKGALPYDRPSLYQRRRLVAAGYAAGAGLRARIKS